MPTSANQADFVAILRQLAPLYGFHVDDGSAKWRDFEQHAKDFPSAIQKTIYVGVWRDKDDRDLVLLVDDGGHLGKAWLIFYRGREPESADQFWEALISNLRGHRTDVLAIPILPSGGLPEAKDLRVTSQGYKIVRSEADRYKLPASSVLLVND